MKKSIKTVLVSLNEKACFESSMSTASKIAQIYDAHLIGLYVIPSVVLYETPYSYGGHITSTHLNRLYRTRASEIEDRYNEYIRQYSLKGEWRKLNSAGHFISDKIIQHGREADLIILGDNDNFQTDKELVARVIQESGRPVLVVPNTLKKTPTFENFIIAWDGSREAARAAFDAIPLLQQSKSTQIISVNSHRERQISGDLPGSELAASLAAYDISVDAISERSRKSPGKVLRNRAVTADLLVMGAYGHSRLRESLFGGVTNAILEELPCPVLLSN